MKKQPHNLSKIQKWKIKPERGTKIIWRFVRKSPSYDGWKIAMELQKEFEADGVMCQEQQHGHRVAVRLVCPRK